MKKAPTKPQAKKVTTKSSVRKPAKQAFGTTIDLFVAVLIVSLLINLFVVCIWVTLSTTTQYDAALAQFLLGR